MNYTQLVSAIKGYAENDFPSTVGNFTSAEQINTFIRQAEQRIYNSVQLPVFRKNMTGTVTPNNPYLQLPNDWLATHSLAVIEQPTGKYSYLLDKDVNFIREAFPFPPVTGKPTHYAQFDENTILLGPTPNLQYVMELHFFYYPETIVTAQTTWLGNNFDSILLYGALLEAAAFMKEADENTLANYTARYNETMSMLKNLGEGKNRTDSYRTQQPRMPVI